MCYYIKVRLPFFPDSEWMKTNLRCFTGAVCVEVLPGELWSLWSCGDEVWWWIVSLPGGFGTATLGRTWCSNTQGDMAVWGFFGIFGPKKATRALMSWTVTRSFSFILGAWILRIRSPNDSNSIAWVAGQRSWSVSLVRKKKWRFLRHFPYCLRYP